MARTSRTNGKPSKAGVKSEPAPPAKALPVTLLSGFLGSGKTTLLQHLLKSNHGYKIAVIVNDIGEINIDASIINKTHYLKKTDEKVIALQNGCICCTLRGDLLEELVRLADLQTFDYIVIESSGISEPEQVAETFDGQLTEHFTEISEAADGEALDESMLRVLQRLKKAGGLEKFATLDTTVTVIDAFTILNDFNTVDMLSKRRSDVEAEDEGTVSDLMVDQIEFANVIVLNKISMVDQAQKQVIMDLVTNLNPGVKILESDFGKIDVREILATGKFNLDQASRGAGWLLDLHAMTVREVNGRKTITPKPETEEYNIRNFIYKRYRPFHPTRLNDLLHDKFILRLEELVEEEEEEEEEDDEKMDLDHGDNIRTEAKAHDNKSAARSEFKGKPVQEDQNIDKSVILKNKRDSPIFARLFRSKGGFFLATRPWQSGDWSQAGAMLTLTGGQQFFCTMSEEGWSSGDPEVDALVKHDIEMGGEWGDRKQELVFIGEKLDTEGITAVLDSCLLNDEEMSIWEDIMRNDLLNPDEKVEKLQQEFFDAWPEWIGEDDDDEDDEWESDEDKHAGHSHAHHKAKRTISKGGIVEEVMMVDEVS